jgi:hypothetical protein
MRILATILLSLATLFADNQQPPSAQAKQAAPTTRAAPRTTRSAPKGNPAKPVHVRQYTRRDGTIVRAHDRAAPGTASKTKGSRAARKTP